VPPHPPADAVGNGSGKPTPAPGQVRLHVGGRAAPTVTVGRLLRQRREQTASSGRGVSDDRPGRGRRVVQHFRITLAASAPVTAARR